MTKEQIEKAGRDYALDQLGIVGLPGRAEAMKAFISGAQWRINSVWHDAETETPRENEPIIGITGKMLCYMGLCGETAKEICPEMTKWAYVADLMPDRKEADK